jgi:polygalacturonase
MVQVDRRTFLLGAAQSAAMLPVASTWAPELTASPVSHKAASKQPTVQLNVRDFGAVGDGHAMDTFPLQQVLDRCSMLGGGEVLVPAGDYLTGSLTIRSNTTLRLSEGSSLIGSPDLKDYPLTQVRWEGKWTKGYLGLISAIDTENVTITGTGKILGNTAIVGRVARDTQWRHPALLEFIKCRNVTVETIYTRQNDMWSAHPVYCENVVFRNVTVNGGADGIDIDSCRQVVIDGCTFDTGDDCISLKSGRGMEGNTIARPTEDVRISNCTFVDHHWACIGIGSETSGGIRNVHVDHCKCLGARTFSIYIKTRVGRGAFIEDIFMNDLEVSGAQAGFLRLNLLDSGKQDEVPVSGDAGVPAVRNFQFTNIKVTDVPVLVDAMNIHSGKPLNGLVLRNITGTSQKGMFLSNIQHAVLENIHVSVAGGPLLSTHNVTGVGLRSATPVEPAKSVDLIAEPATPYVLR